MSNVRISNICLRLITDNIYNRAFRKSNLLRFYSNFMSYVQLRVIPETSVQSARTFETSVRRRFKSLSSELIKLSLTKNKFHITT